MYRLAIFPAILFFFISINIRIWEEHGIDYERALQAEAFRTEGKWSFMFFSLGLYILVLTSMLVYMMAVGYDAMGVPGLGSSWLHPIVLFFILIIWFIFPSYRFFGHVRFYILDLLQRTIAAPLYPVSFKDVWFADQLTSLGDVLFELQFIICIYPANFIQQVKTFCSSTRSIGLPILNVLPFWCRFWQCLRCYRDTRQTSHLVNAGKYASSVLPIILAFFDRVSPKPNHYKTMWLLANITSLVYKFIWDIYKDWSLFTNTKETKNTLLRNILLFDPIWYYVAIVCNLLLRCSWLIVLLIRSYVEMGTTAVEYITWCVVFFELFRRFVWNIFRVEVEHINMGLAVGAKRDKIES
ncbi:hypothetical protein AKO1_005850 [Acrasis kona]|uniref:EXS domain-containing protein n=1 Tax=Acrasis kona TaxID=1008807 RepID=A0AAW2YJP4_9EUKA